MDWTKGLSASYYMTVVDPLSWRDLCRIEITDGSIKREPSGLLHSADITCLNYAQGIEQWIRVYMDARQSGTGAHNALFTGLATSPERNFYGRREENQLQCFSVLKPVDDVLLTRGWYAPAETNGALLIENLLSPTPAPVKIEKVEEPPILSDSIIAEDGETNLTMIERILTAINWRLRILGDGTIHIQRKPENNDISAMFSPLDYDVIETEIKTSADWYSCPNVFMAINEDMTGLARDESDTSSSVHFPFRTGDVKYGCGKMVANFLRVKQLPSTQCEGSRKNSGTKQRCHMTGGLCRTFIRVT